MPATNQPFYVGDYGSVSFQLTVRDQSGNLVAADGTVSFLFEGCVGEVTKTATIISTGVFRWTVTEGFFTQAGSGKVRARLNQVAGPITSSWNTFSVQN